MNDSDIHLAILLIEAIDNDWAVCDDNDEDDFMVLINEDREELEELKPLKKLVSVMEEEGLILLDNERSDSRDAKREFDDYFDEIVPIPFVFMYNITKEGRTFYANNKT